LFVKKITDSIIKHVIAGWKFAQKVSENNCGFCAAFFKKSIDRFITIAYNTITNKQESKTKKEIKKMTVYIVYAYGNVKGVYTTKETAEKVAKKATWMAEMGGSRTTYYVKEMEVED
jgi:hypothetical protein